MPWWDQWRLVGVLIRLAVVLAALVVNVLFIVVLMELGLAIWTIVGIIVVIVLFAGRFVILGVCGPLATRSSIFCRSVALGCLLLDVFRVDVRVG
jgi:hypothetical protein